MHIRVLRYNQKNNILSLGLLGSDFMANTKEFTEIEDIFVYTSGEFGKGYQKHYLQFCPEFNAFLAGLHLKHSC